MTKTSFMAILPAVFLAGTSAAPGQQPDATDDTFKEGGRVGLWTKADSVIQFDELAVEGRTLSLTPIPAGEAGRR